MKNKVEIAAHTLCCIHIHEVWCLSEHDLLQDDSEAVDISFLSSIDRSSCHTEQLRCCPQLISAELKLTNLHRVKHGVKINFKGTYTR